MNTRNTLGLSLLVAAMASVGAARAQTVMCDFDSGVSVPPLGTKTPIKQESKYDTIGMVRYEVTSPGPSEFFIATAKSVGMNLPQFGGNFLWPTDAKCTTIDIHFDRLIDRVSIAFVSLDSGQGASPVTLTVYQNTTDSLYLGGTTAVGTSTEGSLSGGTIVFAAEARPFDVVRLSVKSESATGIAIDTIQANVESCQADFDGDDARTALVAQADIFAYLQAWFDCRLRADFNHDGTMNTQDIFDFLNAWFAGCPRTAPAQPLPPLMHGGAVTETNENNP